MCYVLLLLGLICLPVHAADPAPSVRIKYYVNAEDIARGDFQIIEVPATHAQNLTQLYRFLKNNVGSGYLAHVDRNLWAQNPNQNVTLTRIRLTDREQYNFEQIRRMSDNNEICYARDVD